MIYTVVSFLASHPVVIGSIVAFLALMQSSMPYVEKWMRPKEYVYLAWVENLQSEALLDYQRIEWPHGESTVVLSVPEPKHLEVKGTQLSPKLMLLFPESWKVEMWMGIEGMEPATRHSLKPNLPGLTDWSLRIEDLGLSGDRITRKYLLSPKSDGIGYAIQGIEWWNTAAWNETRRVQITRP